MVEIIEKLKSLAVELEAKIASVDLKSKELANEIKICKDGMIKLTLKEDELIARENRIKSVEDIIKIADESKERMKKASEIKAQAEEKRVELENLQDAIDAKNADLSAMIALYRSKNESLEKEKVQLEADRKEMRTKIIDELKNLK